MEEYDKPKNNIANKAEKLAGNILATASNKVAPFVGPIITQILWKNKWKIASVFLTIMIFMCLAFDSIAIQYTASVRSILELIPKDHKICIQKASEKYEVESELLSAYGKVIADFKTDHKGNGKGFLEIEEIIWRDFGADGNDNSQITETDLCDNYFTLANKLKSILGDTQKRIDEYPHDKKKEVKDWHDIYAGLMLIPYGNPVGLERKELVQVTSRYGEKRIVFGQENIHTGVDMTPSNTWYQENPGKTSKDAVNRATIFGKTSNTIDGAGALCVTVTNDIYKTLSCHCDAFIVQDQAIVKYGDPLCFMGTTGLSTGVHVHYEVYKKNPEGGWNRLDPMPFLFPGRNANEK